MAVRAEEASREIWDIVVAGAGPAGSALARRLAGEGLSVLLIDRSRFPRNKVCGCCLNGSALTSLEMAGLGNLPEELGAPELREVELIGYGRRVELPLPGGRALSRRAFDMALIEAAVRNGSSFMPGTVGTLADCTSEGWSVELGEKNGDSPTTVSARVVVAADGLNGGFLRRHPGFSPVISAGSRIGVGLVAKAGRCDLPPGTIRMVVAPEGYVGLVRLEDGAIDLAAALDPGRLGGVSPEEVVRRILRENGASDDFETLWGLRGTPPLTRRPRKLAGNRLFLVGDATGYVEPFTGEGIAWAMNSALLAAPLVAEAARQWSGTLAGKWLEIHRREIGRRQSACRMLRWILARPRASRTLLAALDATSLWARPVIAGLNRPIIERH